MPAVKGANSHITRWQANVPQALFVHILYTVKVTRQQTNDKYGQLLATLVGLKRPLHYIPRQGCSQKFFVGGDSTILYVC